MNCSECQEFLNLYVSDELESPLRNEIEAHLADCYDCSCEAANWQRCLDALQQTFPDQTIPAELWEKIQAEVKAQ